MLTTLWLEDEVFVVYQSGSFQIKVSFYGMLAFFSLHNYVVWWKGRYRYCLPPFFQLSFLGKEPIFTDSRQGALTSVYISGKEPQRFRGDATLAVFPGDFDNLFSTGNSGGCWKLLTDEGGPAVGSFCGQFSVTPGFPPALGSVLSLFWIWTKHAHSAADAKTS